MGQNKKPYCHEALQSAEMFLKEAFCIWEATQVSCFDVIARQISG